MINQSKNAENVYTHKSISYEQSCFKLVPVWTFRVMRSITHLLDNKSPNQIQGQTCSQPNDYKWLLKCPSAQVSMGMYGSKHTCITPKDVD